MSSIGTQALARLLQQLPAAAARVGKGENPEAVAEELWPEVKSIVLAAQAEMRENEAAGVRRWQDTRHATEK